jgi:hypothetical protein
MLEALAILLGVIALLVIALFYSTLSWGLVLYKFWYWFLLPVFTTLPQVDFYQCAGLFLFISLFKKHSAVANVKDEYTKESTTTVNVINFLMPWLMLGLGYFAHYFIV